MAAKLARSHGAASGSVLDSRRSLLKVGDLLANKYRVQRVIGEGGMGVVVEAYHELLDQRVAVKLLYRDNADREAEARLLLEARASAKLQSEHVARVVDVDVGPDGLPFIVMELLEGADLAKVADTQGALPPWLAVDYLLQALEGLAQAHARGIIHRDLKPSNLFLATRPDGSQILKVLDFGISKASSTSERRGQQLTGGGTVLGSPPYMSPEQVRAPKTVDHRTDIWALGVCLYELLTASMPFGGDEVQETFAQILERRPAPIQAIVPGVPEGLAQVVMRCLAKRREDRFQDVAELARALAPFGSGAWVGTPDRVQATLARALLDDPGSGRHPRSQPVPAGGAAVGIPVPPSSRARPDSLQPGELHGTAATVASTFRQTDARRRWLVAATGVVALAALVVGAAAVVRFQGARTAAAVETAAAEPVPVPVAEAAPPPAVSAVPLGTALPEGEPPPNATILGASVPAAPSGTALAAASASARRPAPVHPAHPAARPSVVVPSKKEKAPDGPPPGLPLTRSGQ